ncbi:MAG: hypothetical protein ACD_8C00001G0002 [uncultured bacterium]|nr:MAG: hypothetical protein ACD_8C00001G0002 [uncultured bacterium]KKP69123.1 MAG: hypothetical protein UR66_C0001G0005 [Candidatus Moranbacteria bacterium GW2011_GWE1_35_17]KKP70827.1 MAG: hypothetical protein UR65_C0037G0002 [Candidatus Moranbacteria bacterium GW2011_GWE2_35_164]KKP83561.1 MAG: hypothetical protein UR82_C0020G0025 [Candidatus Moranbacteria bacterium GW2011_GWF1_35_5]KKP84474.1 MAG: hypothetical protein UR83_C0020G0005 [Candidatus Moranbacteria bacterium GW2011_GWF2_35_54]
MNLTDKIEEIRQKPENERVKYVWFMVSLSMTLIIFIWFFSFKSIFRGNEKINSGQDIITELEKKEPETNNANAESTVGNIIQQDDSQGKSL